MFEDMLEHRL